MLDVRMFAEEVIQHPAIFNIQVGVQVEFKDVTGGMMFLHILAKSDFAAFLLVRADHSFVYLAENYDFPVIYGE